MWGSGSLPTPGLNIIDSPRVSVTFFVHLLRLPCLLHRDTRIIVFGFGVLFLVLFSRQGQMMIVNMALR